ncbi:MAG: glycosyltransferase family 4 protein [Hyphomicrobium sp.]
MRSPLRVLCLDIEGGYGGSSRSLYYLLKNVDRALVEPTVWCRRQGPIQDRYGELGIPVEVAPVMPKASALPKLSRNIVQLGGHAVDYVLGRSRLAAMGEAAANFDVIHFNHEGLATFAYWMRRRVGKPQTMHIRTNVVPSIFSRAQMRVISSSVDTVAFISENEQRTFIGLGGTSPGRIIHNVVEAPREDIESPARKSGDPIIVASLSNAAWLRGTDRLFEVAAILARRGRKDVQFLFAGDDTLSGSWPGPFEAVARNTKSLPEAARALGLTEYFKFLGHVPDPERVVAASDLLIKPTRENNPWGRDILEAMAAGKPVLSVGRDATFVETGVTGVLQHAFDAETLADEILALAADREKLARLGVAARERVLRLCDGPSRARDLADLWKAAFAARA